MTRLGTRRAMAALCVWTAMWTAVAAQSRPRVRLLVSNGVKAAIEVQGAACETATGATLDPRFDTSAALRARAEAGDPFDVAFMTSEAIDALVASGTVEAGSRRLVSRSRIGVGVRAGAASPALSSRDDVRRALLAAGGVTYAGDGASRPFLVKMFDALGIAPQMAAKSHIEQGSVRATGRVVAGQSDVVLTLVSEIVTVPGLTLAGTLPDEFQGEVRFAAAVGARSGQAAAARAVIACLGSPSDASSYARVGLERVGP